MWGWGQLWEKVWNAADDDDDDDDDDNNGW